MTFCNKQNNNNLSSEDTIKIVTIYITMIWKLDVESVKMYIFRSYQNQLFLN